MNKAENKTKEKTEKSQIQRAEQETKSEENETQNLETLRTEKLIEDHNLGLRKRSEEKKLWVKILKSKLGVNKINALYSSVIAKGYSGETLAEGMLKELSVTIREEKSENIAQSLSKEDEGVVIVSNMPHGGIDGLIMLSLCLKYKTNTKIVIPRILGEIKALRDVAIIFDADKKNFKSSFTSMLEHIEKGGNLIIFPSIGVSEEMKDGTRISWKNGMLRLICRLQAPVQPLFIKGGNGLNFQSLRKLNKRIELFLSLREINNKRGSTFKVLEGPRIEKDLLSTIKKNKDLGKLLCVIYGLSLEREKEGVGVSDNAVTENLNPSKPKTITQEQELKAKIKGEKVYNEHLNYAAYLIKGDEKSISEEIIVVDKENGNRVVGYSKLNFADRVLLNKDSEFGFFKDYEYSHKMESLLRESIEIERSEAVEGNSAVVTLLTECQILRLKECPEYRYLISSIEITDSKSKLTRRLITHRIKRFVYTDSYKKMVAARQSLREGSLPFLSTRNEMLTQRRDILLLFARYTDPLGGALSTEMKRYLQSHGEFIALGKIDRDNNKVIKGLMLIDKTKLTKENN